MPPKKNPRPTTLDGWQSWSNHVLLELERLSTAYESMGKDITKITVEIAMLKVKSGVWGAAGAAIPVAIGLAIMFLKG